MHPALWIAAFLMVLPELLFAAVDAGLMGHGLGRGTLYDAFGYWDSDFERLVAGQGLNLPLLWSPLSYAFMHGGWLHLLMNGAAFLGLGHLISQLIGVRRLAMIFVGTAVAGALTYSVISDFPGPLVGASGVVFGLIGTLTAWEERTLRMRGEDRTAIWQRILGLVAINALLDLGLGGVLAWEAHLGGFMAGWLMASLYRPKQRRY